MVKSDPLHERGWAPPRGERDEDARWEHELLERPQRDFFDPLEQRAVLAYQHIVEQTLQRQAARGWSLRKVASLAHLAPSAVSTSTSGSAWPRWRTLTDIAAALGAQVVADDGVELRASLCALLSFHRREVSLASTAAELVVQPRTLYDFCDPARSPSSATVLGLAAYFGTDVAVVDLGP